MSRSSSPPLEPLVLDRARAGYLVRHLGFDDVLSAYAHDAVEVAMELARDLEARRGAGETTPRYNADWFPLVASGAVPAGRYLALTRALAWHSEPLLAAAIGRWGLEEATHRLKHCCLVRIGPEHLEAHGIERVVELLGGPIPQAGITPEEAELLFGEPDDRSVAQLRTTSRIVWKYRQTKSTAAGRREANALVLQFDDGALVQWQLHAEAERVLSQARSGSYAQRHDLDGALGLALAIAAVSSEADARAYVVGCRGWEIPAMLRVTGERAEARGRQVEWLRLDLPAAARARLSDAEVTRLARVFLDDLGIPPLEPAGTSWGCVVLFVAALIAGLGAVLWAVRG